MATIEPITSRRAWSDRLSWMVPVVLLGAALALLTGIVVVSQRVGRESQRPDAPPFSPPAAFPTNYQRLVVRQVTGSAITLGSDSSSGRPESKATTFDASAGAVIEVISPATAASLQPGEWMSVIGITNSVRNFTIHQIVVLPAGSNADADGVARSAAGFGGYEAATDENDRVAFGGTIAKADGNTVTLDGPEGPITVQLSDRAPLFRLAAATAADIREGFGAAAILDASGGMRAILFQPR